MTRARRPPASPPPGDALPSLLRNALASDWRTLAALDTFTGERGSRARASVHESLRVLRAEGVVLEERVGAGGVEVRLLPALPTALEVLADIIGPRCLSKSTAPDGGPVQCDRMGCDGRHFAEYGGPPHKAGDLVHRWTDNPTTPPSAPVQAPAPSGAEASAEPAKDEQGPPEAPRERTASEWIASHNHEPAPPPAKGPGPSSRCAVCGIRFDHHHSLAAPGVSSAAPIPDHPFTAKPRGRPAHAPVPPVEGAAPARLPQARQRRTPGPVVDVASEARLDRARAADPDVAELPTPAEQEAILAEMARKVAEAKAESGDPVPAFIEREIAILETKPRLVNPASGCRPPACHADAIHVPARVRGFVPPLCARHRAWLEGAGGSVAGAEDAAVLRAARAET